MSEEVARQPCDDRVSHADNPSTSQSRTAEAQKYVLFRNKTIELALYKTLLA
jgi:hypothetical protein